MKKIYSDDELFCNNEQKAYSGDAGCVDFLLGGIGTGNVSLGARGNLTTWQIFNQPGQMNRMPYTFPECWKVSLIHRLTDHKVFSEMRLQVCHVLTVL